MSTLSIPSESRRVFFTEAKDMARAAILAACRPAGLLTWKTVACFRTSAQGMSVRLHSRLAVRAALVTRLSDASLGLAQTPPLRDTISQPIFLA